MSNIVVKSDWQSTRIDAFVSVAPQCGSLGPLALQLDPCAYEGLYVELGRYGNELWQAPAEVTVGEHRKQLLVHARMPYIGRATEFDYIAFRTSEELLYKAILPEVVFVRNKTSVEANMSLRVRS